jgi:hypothetical protein
VTITVGSTPPTATITQPASGIHVNVGATVNFMGSASDPDDGNLIGASLQWDVIIHHNTHIHDGLVDTTGCCGSFVVQEHDTSATFYYEIKLTAVDSSGLTGTRSVFVYPDIPTSSCAQPSASTAVVICSPSAGSIASSPVRVSAAGGSSVTLMELWRDGTKIANFTGRSIDTTLALTNGSHKVTVFGKNNGTILASQAVSFTVGSSTCTVPGSPGVNICLPADGSTASSPVRALASGTTTGTFYRMELWVDGRQQVFTNSRTLDWLVSLPSGRHRFAFLAVNTAGNVINRAVYVTVP